MTRSGPQRGSVIFLFPIGVLIVLLLGAITVDLANVWLQQRRLADLADAAANDAVTFAVDQDALRRDGELEIDPERMASIVTASVSRHDSSAPISADARLLLVDGNPAVSVTLESDIDLIFGRLVRRTPIHVEATGIAELLDGPSPP